MSTRDRIRGLFLGTALGDALGMPVETFNRDRIHREHGLVTKYVSTAGHKWFDGVPPGTITDDTQLTLALARAIIDAGKIDLDTIAARHVEAFQQTGFARVHRPQFSQTLPEGGGVAVAFGEGA